MTKTTVSTPNELGELLKKKYMVNVQKTIDSKK